jgi:ribosomal protein S13
MEELLKQFDLSVAEMVEYKKLKRKVYGVGVTKALFMILDFENQEHKRLNELSGKVIKLNAHLVNNRHKAESRLIINKFY